MRAARGSADRENSVGSGTGGGRRETGGARHGNRHRLRESDAIPAIVPALFRPVRNLESFDAWRCGQDLASLAYKLTLSPQLHRHFALIDQIRRAALSIPANIAEGYALGTTPQFLRCLRIALGSTAELRSHLQVARRVHLIPERDVSATLDLCDRMLALVLGLIRKLSR